MAYDCSVKEVMENGQKKFIVEITCKDQQEKEIIREIRYKYSDKGIPIIAKSIATGVEIRFDGIKQASEMLVSEVSAKTRENRIGECLKGDRESYLGYTWRYADESKKRKRRG